MRSPGSTRWCSPLLALPLLFGLAACGATTPAEDASSGPVPSRPFDHSGLPEAEYSGVEVSSHYVVTTDGTRIAVDVYLPAEGPTRGPYPTVFQYTPYQRSTIDPETGEVRDLRDSTAAFFTAHGYAVVVADMRGTGASTGWVLDFMPAIWDDGKEVVDWIAAQPWSDGNVGMSGGSYVGWSQTATASRRPEALKAIAPSVIPLEGFTGEIYPGGIFVQGFIDLWAGFMAPTQRNYYVPDQGAWPAKPVIDEDGDGELQDEIPIDKDGSGTFLDDGPPVYADGKTRDDVYYLATKAHEENYDYAASTREAYFLDAKLPLDYSLYDLGPNAHLEGLMASGIPIYHFGGWFDGFARGSFELYDTLRGTNPEKLAMLPAYHGLTSGPFWQQQGFDLEDVRQLVLGEHLRFFERYLRGVRNGIDREPPIAIFVMNGGGFRFENEWPLAREVRRRYYFDDEHRLAETRGAPGADVYAADFHHDSSYAENRSNRFRAIGGITPADLPWRTDKARQTLVYETPPLAEATEVTGHPTVNLAVSSSASYGDFFVYLEDVDPDGNALLVTEAMLRAGFARLVDNDRIVFGGKSGIDVEPELPWHGYESGDYVDGILADGAVVELLIDFLPTSWVFLPGHRIRVSVAAADWPTFRLHPKLSPTNDPDDAGNVVPTITVHRGEGGESWVELPVIPPSGVSGGATSAGG